ncbi:MAG TPA: hypothetical protein VGJ66_17575 [Pyrinomonadaceae bacterium]|jgi:hypothetical protein
MVILLFTAIFIIVLLAVTLYFWAPRARSSEQNLLPPPNPPRGLFSDKVAFQSFLPPPAISSDRETERRSLNERAKAGDKSTLNEAHAFDDQNLYNEVLDQLTANADRPPTLLALVSYVTRNELPVNHKLAAAVISSWKNSPDRSSTATTLHVTALVDDAALFRSTVEAALHFWRQGLLTEVSAAELRTLFDGEFWVLSARTRNSGAGFVLKRTLANARRELETAIGVN